jgi:hypothetical protein
LAGELADGVVLDVPISAEGVRSAVVTAAARRPHEVVVYVSCEPGQGAPEVARTMQEYADAGATTVVVEPAGDDPDVAATIRLAGAARALLRG